MAWTVDPAAGVSAPTAPPDCIAHAVSRSNVSQNCHAPAVATPNTSQNCHAPTVSTPNTSSNRHAPAVSTPNMSSNCRAPAVSTPNTSRNCHAPAAASPMSSRNCHAPTVASPMSSSNWALPIVSSLRNCHFDHPLRASAGATGIFPQTRLARQQLVRRCRFKSGKQESRNGVIPRFLLSLLASPATERLIMLDNLCPRMKAQTMKKDRLFLGLDRLQSRLSTIC